jgi:hypothetical protein
MTQVMVILLTLLCLIVFDRLVSLSEGGIMRKEVPVCYGWVCARRLGGCGYVGPYDEWKVRVIGDLTTFDCPRCHGYHAARLMPKIERLFYFCSTDNWKQASALIAEEWKLDYCLWAPGDPDDYVTLQEAGRAMIGHHFLNRYGPGQYRYHDGDYVYPDLMIGLRVMQTGEDETFLIHKDDIRLLVARIFHELLNREDVEGYEPPFILPINPSDD